MKSGNFIQAAAASREREVINELLRGVNFRLEQIISCGQATPAGEWYDQQADEWVMLLSGSARLRFEAEADLRELKPGDWLFIPAHCRHRVEWTDPEQPSVWLALHYSPANDAR